VTATKYQAVEEATRLADAQLSTLKMVAEKKRAELSNVYFELAWGAPRYLAVTLKKTEKGHSVYIREVVPRTPPGSCGVGRWFDVARDEETQALVRRIVKVLTDLVGRPVWQEFKEAPKLGPMT
jgi:hypothetical protein